MSVSIQVTMKQELTASPIKIKIKDVVSQSSITDHNQEVWVQVHQCHFIFPLIFSTFFSLALKRV